MNPAPISADALRAAIRNVPDFPKPGIQFKDITPVLADPALFAACVEQVVGPWTPGSIDAVVGIDARGFILAAAAALRLRTGFVPVRKHGKLPAATFEASYDLEYGSNTVAIHRDAFQPGSRVLLIDDLLATGGTAGAAARLVEQAGGRIMDVAFFIELSFLGGRQRLAGLPVRSIVTF